MTVPVPVSVSEPQSPARSRASSTSTTSSSAALPTFEALAPPRAPTTVHAEEALIRVSGVRRRRPGRNPAAPGSNRQTTSAGTDSNAEAEDEEEGVRLKVDAGPGCGGIAWPAGEVLSRYIAHRHAFDPSFLRNKSILELGSGTGLVGLAAGLLEPTARVEVTDQAVLLDLMQANISLNYPASSIDSDSAQLQIPTDETDQPSESVPSSNPETRPNVCATELNWGDPLPSHIDVGKLDMVLAADCVYFEPAFPLLLQTLLDLCSLPSSSQPPDSPSSSPPYPPPSPPRPQPLILFCWKKRRKADKRFFAMLRRHFDSVHIDDDAPGARETYSREGVSLLRLIRRK